MSDTQLPAVRDPQVVLDTNVHGKAYLYNTMCETTEYYTYDGPLMDVRR
jgi:hypothetical protein